MKRFIVLDKKVGATPLECAETWRATQSAAYQDVPLAYAGRLDPMASGKLLVLIGDECKLQSLYHGLDKTYEFEVLLGIASDSGDVLGIVESTKAPAVTQDTVLSVLTELLGTIRIPYPHFSSKTVEGKPLHTWTLEGRLSEIDIPTKQSDIYKLKLLGMETISHDDVLASVRKKVETIKPVTDERKAIGNDFRRPEVRAAWDTVDQLRHNDTYQVLRISCTCSSGTYMRSLAEIIAKRLNTIGLAYSIHRTQIGHYQPLPFGFGYWKKKI